ncbi:hypothetical protein [Pseudomonas sp. RC10]|uniref:hypothetical protein n=1 Tax=Pseudomonas bambusae TaxID=3139142 RepID=UPI00313883FE
MLGDNTKAKIVDDHILIPAYDWSDIGMFHWSKQWTLATAGRICCTQCAATQPASKNYEPFVHQDICPEWGKRDQYPWASLRKIIDGLPTEAFQPPTGPGRLV